MKRYFPILLSKAGEFVALSNLVQNVKDEIVPVIQVLPENYDRVETFASSDWVFSNNQLFLDFSLCDPFDRTATRNLIVNLNNAGVNVVPVVQTNSDARYIAVLQSLVSNGTVTEVCTRFSNASGGFINLDAQIATLLGTLVLNYNQASILLDFGLLENHNYNLIAALAIGIINGITNKEDYQNIIVASSSFLENLTSLAPAGRLYRLQRYEWDVWQTLQAQPNLADLIKYGDYGTKYPYYVESKFQGTCSIKYTLPTEFIVYRGELSGNHPQGNGQYIIFADRLVRSADYSGNGFSWGDAQIDFYASQILTDPKRKTGNSTTWVEISQNHHITMLHSLL